MNRIERLRLRDEVFKTICANQLEALRFHDEDYTLDIPYQRLFGLLENENEKYEKKRFSHENTDFDFITNTTALTKSTEIIIHTDPQNIRKALKWGLLKPHAALTSIAISHVGRYRQIVAQRAFDSNMMSDQAETKEALVEFFQTRVESLEPLERLILSGNKQQILDALWGYASRTRPNLKNKPAAFERYYADHLQDDSSRALQLRKAIENCQDLKKIHHLLQAFIKSQIKHHLSELQSTNQMLTYELFRLDRGDLNSCCEEALYAVEQFEPDLHDPITRKHQYHFDDGKIAISSRDHTDDSTESLENWLRNMSCVTGVLNLHEKNVRRSKFTKWSNYGKLFRFGESDYTLAATFASMFYNHVIPGALIGVLNFFECLFLGENAGAFAKWFMWPENFRSKKNAKPLSDYSILHSKLPPSRIHVTTKLGLFFHKFFVHTCFEAIKGIAIGFVDSFKTFPKIWYDLKNGYLGETLENKKENVFQRLAEELKIIREEKETCVLEFSYLEKLSKLDDQEIVYARPDYKLTPYHSNGLLPLMAYGTRDFADFFELNIYAKHPFAAVLFSLAYLAGGGAIVAPQLLQFLGPFVSFSKSIGVFFTSQPPGASQFISTAITEAQILSGAWEGVLHGPDSWIAKAMNMFAKDPLTVSLGFLSAYGIGHALIASQIPGFSEYLSAELPDNTVGKVIDEAFIGVKGGLGLGHLILGHRETDDATLQMLRKIFVERLSEILKSKNVDASPEKIYEIGKNIFNKEVIAKIQEGINAKLTTDIKLLTLLLAHPESDFKYLSTELKEDLRHLLPEILGDHAPARSIMQLCDSESSKAPLASFFNSIFTYPGLLLRCFLSIFTGSARPWKELGWQILNDMTSTLTAIKVVTFKISEMFINRIPRFMSDVLVNEIFCRVTSWFKFRKPTEYAYAASVGVGVLKSELADLVETPVTFLQKQMTAPNPGVALAKNTKVQTFFADRMSEENDHSKSTSNHLKTE